MKLYADYHTHTVFSHGSGTVMENARAAVAAGLKEMAVSDHGFAHPFFGLKREALPALRRSVEEASRSTGVRVLMGIESNFVDGRGTCDLKEEDYDKFDVFLAGVHVMVNYRDLGAFWNMGVLSPAVNSFGGTLDGKVKSYITDVYVNAVRRQPIDVITHLDYRVFADVKEVAACCKEYGTYIEINTKKTHMTDEQWRAVMETGVNFVIGSDAHSPDRVADADPAFALMQRVGIPAERVHNLDRLPSFRFAAYKRGQR